MSKPIVSFDEQAVRDELRELVRKTIEETINAMYLAGVLTRRIEDVSEILWGAGVSAGTVSNLNEKSPKSANERWRRPPTREYPYVYVNGIYPKRSRDGSYKNVAVMVAVGVNEDGYREAIECAEGFTEPAKRWHGFLSWQKSRGLRGVRMLTGDKAYRKAEISRNTAYSYLAKNDLPHPGRPSVPLFALGGINARGSAIAMLTPSTDRNRNAR